MSLFRSKRPRASDGTGDATELVEDVVPAEEEQRHSLLGVGYSSDVSQDSPRDGLTSMVLNRMPMGLMVQRETQCKVSRIFASEIDHNMRS